MGVCMCSRLPGGHDGTMAHLGCASRPPGSMPAVMQGHHDLCPATATLSSLRRLAPLHLLDCPPILLCSCMGVTCCWHTLLADWSSLTSQGTTSNLLLEIGDPLLRADGAGRIAETPSWARMPAAPAHWFLHCLLLWCLEGKTQPRYLAPTPGKGARMAQHANALGAW